ncbi:MAG: hypothetical protein PHG41_05395 [Actinomycetota bacterium]|nr:hypothetical protein [Actinomycetota bacterium]
MKKHLFILSVAILILLLTLITVSCRKEAIPPKETTGNESQETEDKSTIDKVEEADIDKEEDKNEEAKDNIDKIKAAIPEAVAKSKIAFVSASHQGGSYDIYIMNGDGTNRTNITNTPDEGEFNPCFSPDGTKIAFDCDGTYQQIYIMNTDGSGRTRLTDLDELNENPCFSPDGTKIAFTSWRDEGPEVYIMNIDGSEQTRLTNNPPEGSGEPCFSPDGTKIAFSSRCSGNWEIYIINIDGSCQVNITNNPAPDLTPCFSPDGTKIVFVSYPEPVIDYEVPYEIYIINADGSGRTRLTDNSDDDMSSCFSPDGTKIAFVTGRDKIRIPGGYLSNDEIYLMNPDGSCQVNITNNPDGDDWRPCFSPLSN